MAWRPTQRSFVNTWECDENEHLNIQFYVSRFSDAAAHLLAAAGIPSFGPGSPRLLMRHIRYHRELRAAALTQISSARLDPEIAGGADFALAHRMVEPSRGFTAATAVDLYADARSPALDALASVQLPEEAVSRSLGLEPDREERGEAALRASGYLEVDRTVLRATGESGRWTPADMIGRVSDGMAFVFELSGITRDILDDAGRGRVTVEMRISPLAALEAGAPIVTLAGVVGTARSTLTVRDVVVDARSDRPAAVVSVTALVMDLASRRAVPFEPPVVERLKRALVRD